MIKLPDLPRTLTLRILRIITGIIFITHGAARFYYDSLADFGAFLSAQGLPAGLLFAWMVTLGELVAGTLLAVGFRVRYCVLFHAVVLLAGMFLIHFELGWFVVGHGTGGVEYSLLLLAVLAFLYADSD